MRTTHLPTNPFEQYLDYAEKHPNEFSNKMKLLFEMQKRMLERFDFIEEKGRKACDWIEKYCILVEGERAGKKVKLLLWQKWFIYSILCFYGEIDTETFDEQGEYIGKTKKYTRIVNDVLLVVASGNAKTTLIGFINSYFLYSGEFPACKIYIGSNAYKQSRLCFDTTLNIILSNPVLDKFAEKRASIGEIEIPKRHARVTAMSSDGSNLEGIIPAVLIIDEIHEMKNSAYADNLRKSTKRDDFLIIETTTQGTVRGGYLDERMELATNTLRGTTKIEDFRKLFVIFEQDSEEEISVDDIPTLKKSNPSLGFAVSVPLLKDKIIEMQNDERKRVVNLTKNFNIPQNPITSYFTRSECQAKPFDESIFNNAPVFLGLDMAYTRTPASDLCCLEMLMVNPFTEEEYTKDIYFLPKYWDREVKNGEIVTTTREDMIAFKSKEDSNILYNERTGEYGYQLYADRGDLVIIDEDLIEEMVNEFGEQARMDCTGVTENFILLYLAHLELKYQWFVCKFGLDPNKAALIQSQSDLAIPSIDGKPPTIKFRMEDKKNSNPIIESTKEKRSRGLVYNNNKLTELHFASAQAKEDAYGYIVFTNAQAEKKDGVIANLAARSAYNVWINNKDTGAMNRRLLEEWWNGRIAQESIQDQTLATDETSGV